MRKSSLVKAMACFMAATMAVTCVPGVNVTNGVAVAAETEETVTVSAPIVSYDFTNSKLADTSSRKLGNVILSHNAEATKEGIKLTDGYIQLSDKIFNNLNENTKGITIVTTHKKNTSSFPGSDWSEPLAAFGTAEDNTSKKEFRVQANGNVGMYDNSAELYYSSGGSWADGTTSKKPLNFDNDVWHTTAVTYNFAENQIILYQDGKEIFDSKDATWEIKAKLSIEDFKSFTNNWIGKVPWGWSMWSFTTISNFSVYDSILTAAQIAEIAPINHCKSLKFAEEDNITVATDIPFTLTAKLTGESIGNVTDPITASAIDATIKVNKEFDGTEYVLDVTPTKVTTQGAVTVTCGSIGKTYHFQSTNNPCDSIIVSDGGATQIDQDVYSISTPVTSVEKLFAFNIKATSSTDKTVKLSNRIKQVNNPIADGETEQEHTHYFKKNGVKYYPTGILETGLTKTIIDNDGVLEEQYVARVHIGNNDFLFSCGNKEIVVRIVGTDGSTSTGTPSAPSTDNSTPSTDTPGTDTPSTTPGAVTPDTPSTDNNTPSTDNNTPSTDNNTPSTDNNNTSDDNNDDTKTKTTKKKAKVASVTAKKGKKVVSGTVKISATGKKVSKATVKVYVNSKKKVTVKTKSTGKFTAKLSKKLKKGDKVKLVITKSNIKKITKTVKVK